MARQITKKQKGFINDYLETGNGVLAALNNYDTTDYSTAGTIAWENLKKPAIQQKIQDAAEEAFEQMKNLSKASDSDNVKFSATKDILDRAGFKPVERTEVKGEITATGIDPTNPKLLEALQKIQDSIDELD